MRSFVITIAALLAGIAAAAYAAQDLSASEPVTGAMPARLAAADTDHDGRWSKAEWLAAGRKARGFDAMDTNHDGFLTIEELKAGLARFHARREQQPAQ